MLVRKAQQTIVVNGICGAVTRGAADLVIFPFTLIKARLEVRDRLFVHLIEAIYFLEFTLYKNEHDYCY
jgi:hypothetical protein